MDMEAVPSSRDLLKCCDCACSCCFNADQYSGTWMRSVKRKHDEFKMDCQLLVPSVARVEIGNEVIALREMVNVQQKTIQDMNEELEEERNSSSTAANEAMSMILRLQREKAEIQMEARQFKRFAEEKMMHDQEELMSLEDLLYKREQIIQSLTCEVQAYKHRMMSFGYSEDEVEGDQYDDISPYEYPPLKCNVMHHAMDGDNDDTDVEKYVFGDTPNDRLRNLENRISKMEKIPTYSQVDGDYTGKNVLEKVIVGPSPSLSRRHSRKVSSEIGLEFPTESPKNNSNSKKDYFSQPDDHSNLKKVDNASEGSKAEAFEDYTTPPKESGNHHADFEDPYIRKLYLRLQALEADRESMRQAIISMSTDKAQVVLLKEIAQHLCKEMTPQRKMTTSKSHITARYPLMSIFKWITSIVFWRKKAHESKYMFGLPADSMGLLLLLDKRTHARPWRCISSTQVGD
ncbi:unnamed protein product [Vicia faba]|uniref:GTD-binding domain-containing protein n=1 Tax=Vicia faba TaxID=3906 RepID=A0AAV0ZV53_VICFA|nr:unnamed protein product [Vicia faba]